MPKLIQAVFNEDAWRALFKELTPSREERITLLEAFHMVAQALEEVGDAQLVGSVAQDVFLRGTSELDIVVMVPAYKLNNHQALLKQCSAAVSQLATNIIASELTLTFDLPSSGPAGIRVTLSVGSELQEGPAKFLDPELSPQQRAQLAASAAPLQCSFLSMQPRMYKDMMRCAEHWRLLNAAALGKALPRAYFVRLLMLDACQRQQAQQQELPAVPIAPGAFSQADQASEEAAEHIFKLFLQSVASLSPATFITWEVLYRKDSVVAFMKNPEGARQLQPNGPHPIVMDPANPTANVAAELWDIQPMKELAEYTLSEATATRVAELQSQVNDLYTQLQRFGPLLWALAVPSTAIEVTRTVKIYDFSRETSAYLGDPIKVGNLELRLLLADVPIKAESPANLYVKVSQNASPTGSIASAVLEFAKDKGITVSASNATLRKASRSYYEQGVLRDLPLAPAGKLTASQTKARLFSIGAGELVFVASRGSQSDAERVETSRRSYAESDDVTITFILNIS